MQLMQKQAPTLRPAADDGRSSRCRASACCCSCGWLRRPGAAQAEGLPLQGRVPRGHAARPRRPTCASPACRSARSSRRTSTSRIRNRTVATIQLDQQVRAAAHRRQGDPAPEDAARRDLRRADAGHERAPKIPENGWLADSQVAKTVELDEIFQALDPVTRQRVPGLAAVPCQGRRRPRRATSTTRSATCRGFAARRDRRARRARRAERARSSGWSRTPAWCSAR